MPGDGRIPTFPTTASRRCNMGPVNFADSISATFRITFEERPRVAAHRHNFTDYVDFRE
jgi:hypothetical protein